MNGNAFFKVGSQTRLSIVLEVKETRGVRLRKFKRHLMMPSKARKIFFKRAINYVLQTIIYFAKNHSENIYFENIPPPPPACKLNGGSLTDTSLIDT